MITAERKLGKARFTIQRVLEELMCRGLGSKSFARNVIKSQRRDFL